MFARLEVEVQDALSSSVHVTQSRNTANVREINT